MKSEVLLLPQLSVLDFDANFPSISTDLLSQNLILDNNKFEKETRPMYLS